MRTHDSTALLAFAKVAHRQLITAAKARRPAALALPATPRSTVRLLGPSSPCHSPLIAHYFGNSPLANEKQFDRRECSRTWRNEAAENCDKEVPWEDLCEKGV